MMIIDEIAIVLERECKKCGISHVAQITGLKTGKIYNIINGCNFVINAELIAAMRSLGYDICLNTLDNT